MSMFSRRWTHACASAIALLMSSPVPQAFAQEIGAQELHTFDIPAGPLAPALNRFASESRLALVFPAELARGRTTEGLSGSFTLELALNRLLGGTNLTYRFSDASTVVIEEAPEQRSNTRVLGPVRVEGETGSDRVQRGEGVASLGGVRGHQDEESVGFRARVATVASGAPTPLEDIPRSISVMTQAQMEAQDISDIGEALRHLPGITLVDVQGSQNPIETGSYIFSRGYSLQRAQVDGGGSTRLNILDRGILDLGGYERIELVRGPNGVFVGGDNPGGTLNFVRKRPGADPALKLTGIAGAWNRYFTQLDYSTPSLLDSGVAFRSVLSGGRQDFFYDNSDKKTFFLYGIFDIPLTPSSHLELGAQYSRIRENGTYGGLPRFLEGPPVPLPRDTNLAPDWHHQYLDSRNVFARIDADISENWQFQAGVSYTNTDADTVNFLLQPAVLQATGRIVSPDANSRYLSQFQAIEQDSWTADAKITGRFDTGFLAHNVLLLADLSEELGRGGQDQNPLDFFNKPILTVADFTSGYPQPQLRPKSNLLQKTSSSRMGFTISEALSFGRYFDLIATARRYDSQSTGVVPTSLRIVPAGTPGSVPFPNSSFAILNTDTVQAASTSQSRTSPTWRPTFAAVAKPTERLSLFATHAEGSQDQSSAYSKSGPLSPTTFENREFGIKYGQDAWQASLTRYRLVTTNSARAVEPRDLTCGPTGTLTCYYRGGDTVRSTGIDFEVTGMVLPGVEIIASYNYNNSLTISTQAPLQSRAPGRMAKAFLSWRPQFFSRAAIQAGVTWQGKAYTSGNVTPYDPDGNPITDDSGRPLAIPYEYAQDAYALYDLGLSYRVNDATDLSLLVENLTDKTYFATPDSSSNYVGTPRNFTLTMRWTPWNERAAPRSAGPADAKWFGLEGWYVAGDFGHHIPETWSARSGGTKSDGSNARWSFHLNERYLLAGRVGYRFGTHWRAEAEAAYRPARLLRIEDSSTVAPFGVCDVGSQAFPAPAAPGCRTAPGTFDVSTLLGNAIFDWGTPQSRFRPFVGAGIGLARTSFAVVGRYDAPGPVQNAGGNTQSVRFAWQVQAGLGVSLTKKLQADVSYRYLGVPGVPLETFAVDPWLKTFSGDYADQAFSAGLRWEF